MAFKFNINPDYHFNPFDEIRKIIEEIVEKYKEHTPLVFQTIVQYVIIVGSVFVLTMVGSAFNTLYISPITDLKGASTDKMFQSIALYALSLLILFFIFRLLYPDKTKYLFLDKWEKSFLRSGFLYACVMLIATTVWSLFSVHVLNVASSSTNQSVLKSYIGNNEPSAIWFILITVLFGPIFEEVVYRKLAIGSLHAPKPYIYTRATLSVLIFTLLHVWYEFSQMMVQPSVEHLIVLIAHIGPYLIIAITFTYIYLKKRALWASITLHVINNSIAICFMFL